MDEHPEALSEGRGEFTQKRGAVLAVVRKELEIDITLGLIPKNNSFQHPDVEAFLGVGEN
jgi:hypothetical protein